jgi:poly [ADP-ribose] polymerase 2/3/4
VKKMPLGNLSQTQVNKGYDVLNELKQAIADNDSGAVARLTSRFYTVIPHNFGRARPPLIDTPEKLQSKYEMCDVLADIETAQVHPPYSVPMPHVTRCNA